MADTEQGGAPSATAAEAPAPTFDHESAQESVRRLAQLFGMSVADVAGPPFRPNCRCQVTPVPDVCVNTSGEDQRRGIVSRSTTREQIASFGQQLVNVFGEPDPWDAEIERLRDDAEEANTWRIRAINAEQDLTDARTSYDVALREDNEAREEWKRADAEVTRLRGELAKANSGWETWREERRAHDKRQDNELRVVAERLHELIGDTQPCTVAPVSARHLHGLLDRVVAERDRLRQELDLVGEQHAAGLVTLRTDFTAAVNGLLPKLAEPNRQGCPCKSQCDYLDGEDRCSDSCNCAAGRRWVAGDPEPEIGTTVRPANSKLYGGPYTRRHNGWHTDFECPPDCDKAGGSWSWVISDTGGVVEVVDTDG